jgi:hypothetical protein
MRSHNELWRGVVRSDMFRIVLDRLGYMEKQCLRSGSSPAVRIKQGLGGQYGLTLTRAPVLLRGWVIGFTECRGMVYACAKWYFANIRVVTSNPPYRSRARKPADSRLVAT